MGFNKGHKNYYRGKKIDKDKFLFALKCFCAGKMTIETASKYIGLSSVTTTKRFNEYLVNGKLPDYLWAEDILQYGE